ncbi:MAG: hypothetical protein WD178_03420, partial [Actinomycetota bacterium]
MTLFVAGFLLALLLASSESKKPPVSTPTPASMATATVAVPATPTEVSATLTPSPIPATDTPTATVAAAGSFTPSATATLSATGTPPASSTPYPGDPACVGHSTTGYHALWDGNRGCHYDHEHGDNPFTPAVAAAFPGFDLFALLGNVEIGHTNLSSSMENTMKHGGFKWDVVLSIPCPDPSFPNGFEGAQNCVAAAVIQYHNFGRYELEFETRIHTAVILARVCPQNNPSNCGYIYTTQFQEYGQRVTPYQGTLLDYPDNFQPTYADERGPYNTADCVGTGLPGCRTD